MAYALPSSSKKSDKPTYFKRKMDAYRAFGTALSRPQSNFRQYLIEKRKLNPGYLTRENCNLEAIRGFHLNYLDLAETPSPFPEAPLPISNQMYTMVSEDDQFNDMLHDLENAKEFTLDLEANTEHSYYGMTCLLQIGTHKTTYLVDPFPQFQNVKTHLKNILESTEKIKIVHGGDNDYIALNRDFGINMAGVLDLQFVAQQIFMFGLQLMRQGKVGELKNSDYLWRSVTDENGKLLTTGEITQLATGRIGLKKLAKLYFPTYPEPADATLDDWRIRPLENSNMINYAVYDVYILLHIWEKMKSLVTSLKLPESMLANAVGDTSKLLEKYFSPKPNQPLEKKLAAAKIVPVDRSLFEVLYNFRQNRAKIVDESEEELLKLSEINTLIKRRPQDEDAVVDIVQRGRSIPSESIKETSKSILKLLGEGSAFYHRMKETKCHVCNGTYDYPHVAWGCIEPYSESAVSAYMARPENAAFNAREHQRRVRNWHAKRGNHVPFPPPPPQ